MQVLEIDKDNRRLSLGHKQLEENPWDVFETIFTVGSVHEGTIIEMVEKGAVIALPYGVEGFATPKHLVKADGSRAQLDEKLNFKVIEFNKDSSVAVAQAVVRPRRPPCSTHLSRRLPSVTSRLLHRSRRSWPASNHPARNPHTIRASRNPGCADFFVRYAGQNGN